MPGNSRISVADLIDELQSGGRYTVSLEEIAREVGGSSVARRSAVRRLKEKGRLVSPRRGFLVIVPIEYRSTGSPPASWFVDDLMGYLDQAYYVGLLSAAAVHGAAHQHPQVFQVVTDVPTPVMSAGKVSLAFYRKRRIARIETERVKTETGAMNVSSPAATLFDLVRHVRAAGNLDNVATVFAELAEKVSPRAIEGAAAEARLPEIQRAGYLLELVGRDELARPLVELLAARRVRPALLRTGAGSKGARRDERWKLILNERVEPDL